jgi:hypothetical protein
VQADGGLAGAGRTLDADRLVGAGPDDLVLLGLDGRDDVAHRPDAGALDLLGEDPAVDLVLGAVLQVLVLVGRDGAVVETEPAPQDDPHRLGVGRAVERRRHPGTPVDDQRVALGVGDVATPDVPAFRPARVVGVVGVDPPEEQGGRGVVLERSRSQPQVPGQVLGRDRVVRLDLQRQGLLTHPREGLAGGGEVGLFALELWRQRWRDRGGRHKGPPCHRTRARSNGYHRSARPGPPPLT